LQRSKKLSIKHEPRNKYWSDVKFMQVESSYLDKHGSKILQHKESWPFWNVPRTSVHTSVESRKKKYFFYWRWWRRLLRIYKQ